MRAEHRSTGVWRQLMMQAQAFSTHKGWKRLEVITPPLPAFDNTLAFYRREGFAITGGRKLKRIL